MSKVINFSTQASANSVLYQKESNKNKQRVTSTGFPAFFKWFKRNEREQHKIHHNKNGNSKNTSNSYKNDFSNNLSSNYDSQETLSPRSSPILNNLSPSSSCDSILSTSTTGFAYIRPSNSEAYESYKEPFILNNSEQPTDILNFLVTNTNEQTNKTLQQKYNLYSSDSISSNYDNIQVIDRSLPISRKKKSECNVVVNRKQHRRTLSEGSKEKKPGPHIHVKGKRKAPPPPIVVAASIENNTDLTDTLSSISTLGRRKRQAPLPPSSSCNKSNSSSKTPTIGISDDIKSKSILESTSNDNLTNIKFETTVINQTIKSDKMSTKHQLTDQQKQILLDNVLKSQSKPSTVQVIESSISTTGSPISPRPWYKRSFSTNRDSSIPFKREVVLKTMEKRKNRSKDQIPEVGCQRPLMFEANHKFGFLLRQKDYPDDNKVKRKSGIGMPNISELDREATEIINKENASIIAKKKIEEEKFYKNPEFIVLDQDMFESKYNLSEKEKSVKVEKITSAKELISRFEASSNSPHPTSNMPFFGKNDDIREAEKKVTDPDKDATTSHIITDMKNISRKADNYDKCKIIKISWKCPFCTFENPNWRIICEICERIKPFKNLETIKNSQKEIKVNLTKPQMIKKTNVTGINLDTRLSKSDNPIDLDKKTEMVLKYFMPKPVSLSKSASEAAVDKNLNYSKKYSSPSKLAIGSPKFEFKNKQRKNPSSIPEEKENNNQYLELKKPLIDSSAVQCTVTPVFYAKTALPPLPLADEKDEIKNSKNSSSDPVKSQIEDKINKSATNEHDLISNDINSLEREKKRLREMIRAMNAKALADKYPVIKNISVNHSNNEGCTKEVDLSEYTEITNNFGAIKKNIQKNSNLNSQNYEKTKKDSSSSQTSSVIQKKEKNNFYADIKNLKVSEDQFESNITGNNNNLDIKTHSLTPEGSYTKIKNIQNEKSFTDTIALKKIMRNLELAISAGKDDIAAKIAIDLAKMKVSLHVTKQKSQTIPETIDELNKNIIIDLYVEDNIARKGPIQVPISPLLTVAELKSKIFKDYKIPIEVQKWLINNEFALDDSKTLLDLGVINHNSTFHLFIITEASNINGIKEKNYKIVSRNYNGEETMSKNKQNEYYDKENYNNSTEDDGSGSAALPTVLFEAPSWSCPLCTLINGPEKLYCAFCSSDKPTQYNFEKDIISNKLEETSKVKQSKNDLSKITTNRKSSEKLNIIIENAQNRKPSPQNQNFSSPNITKYKYRGVDNFNPKLTDIELFETSKNIQSIQKRKAPTVPSVQNTNHYLELLDLENDDIVPNVESFECPICFMTFDVGQGAILRDCLHTFCRECLSNTIQYSEEAEIKCPYMDADYSCESVLQDREIKAFVTKEIYELHLAKSVTLAENQIKNTFHCKTPNCRGWCIYEDNVNLFKCPVCQITNCLTCRVVHDGLSCKQYQDRLISDCDSNIEAKRTKEMLDEMLQKGEAMNCPTCQVIMMKKWGCDWLKCSMCKTEVCWVTRGPRWGPNGKGDTTGGCMCGVDGIKCHPKCNYCH